MPKPCEADFLLLLPLAFPPPYRMQVLAVSIEDVKHMF